MQHALIWLLVVELLGLVAFPLAYILFRRLPDRGFVFSKLLALLLSSYVLWVLGLTHALSNARHTIIAILAVLALVSALVLWRKLPEIVAFVRRERLTLFTAELVFLGLYFLWLSVVSLSPAINHTEKPMDFAFLNSILRSTYFPPEDPWLAGHSISYYYFGHFMMAFLTKLTAIPSSISYNLSIALIPALVGAGAFSLVYNLIRLSGGRTKVAILFALAAPAFIVLIGNLEGALEFVYARGWGSEGFWDWISIKGLDGGQVADPSAFPRDYWWWWRGTRVIDTVVGGASLDYTITEFPFFSFLLGDLHAHVSALPFVILALALGLNLFVSNGKLGLAWVLRHPWEMFAMALSLGALAFINIWDFPIIVVLFVAVVLLKSYSDWGGQLQRSLVHSLTVLAPVLVGAVLLFLPFYLTLATQTSGILPLRDVSTRPFFFFLIWGLFLVLGGSFLLLQLRAVPGLRGRNPDIITLVMVITLVPFLLWAGIELVASVFDGGVVEGLGRIGSRFGKLLPGLLIVAMTLYSILLRVKSGGAGATAFTLLLLALAFYLLIGVELFYLVDLFGNRMNTVFKAYYQAWLFLAIVSAYGLYYCCSRGLPSLSRFLPGRAKLVTIPLRLPAGIMGMALRYGWVGLVVVLLLVSIYYPVGAALDKTRGNDGSTLDGLAYLRRGDLGEYEAIKWLRDEAPYGRIVEAVGDDYSQYGRISSSTGLPTILGWKFHEHQWRGSTRPFRGREEQVAQIYRTSNPEEARQLLTTYDIRYIYLGARERKMYGNGHFDKFSEFLQPVFRNDGVVIYETRLDGDRGIVEKDDRGAG